MAKRVHGGGGGGAVVVAEEASAMHGAVVDDLLERLVFVGMTGVVDVDEGVGAAGEEEVFARRVEFELG